MNTYDANANTFPSNANPGFTYPNTVNTGVPVVTTAPVVEHHGLGAATQLGVNHNYSHDNSHPTGLGAATGLGVDHRHVVAPIGTVHQVPPVDDHHKHHLGHHEHTPVAGTGTHVGTHPVGTHPVGTHPVGTHPVGTHVGTHPVGTHVGHHAHTPVVGAVPTGPHEHGNIGAPGAVVEPIATALQHKVETVKQAVVQDHREIDLKAQDKIAQLAHDAEVRHAKLDEKDANINKHERVDARLQAKVNDVEENALKQHHKVDEKTTKKVNKLT